MFAITLGPSQIVILLLIGVLLFGHRLPEVGRSLAKAIREFQNGLNGIEDRISEAITAPEPALSGPRAPQRVSPGAPRLNGTGDSAPSA